MHGVILDSIQTQCIYLFFRWRKTRTRGSIWSRWTFSRCQYGWYFQTILWWSSWWFFVIWARNKSSSNQIIYFFLLFLLCY